MEIQISPCMNFDKFVESTCMFLSKKNKQKNIQFAKPVHVTKACGGAGVFGTAKRRPVGATWARRNGRCRGAWTLATISEQRPCPTVSAMRTSSRDRCGRRRAGEGEERAREPACMHVHACACVWWEYADRPVVRMPYRPFCPAPTRRPAACVAALPAGREQRRRAQARA
jgi:hypothetical protein